MARLLPIVFLLAVFSGMISVSAKSSAKEKSLNKKAKGNILFAAPVGSKSHKMFYSGIVEALAADGYKITFLTPYPAPKPTENVHEVLYPEGNVSSLVPNFFKDGQHAVLNVMFAGPPMCLDALQHERTKEVLKENYDLIFISLFFGDCFLGIAYEREIPFVLVSPAEMISPFNGLRTGNPNFPSFDNNPLLTFDHPLSFFGRLVSTVADTALTIFVKFAVESTTKDAKSRGIFAEDMPDFNAIGRNASLVIANSFRHAEHPRPYLPNILLAGGIHLKPSKPLPADLEEWVNSSGNAGVIFFSLGSAVRSSDLPEEIVKIILSVFESLPQKVLWKFDLDEVKGGIPKNVRITKWAPQQDLLGHPKMKLFISHGGIFSTQEAQYHGVPVLGMPVFGDQNGNIRMAEQKGFAKMLSWNNINYDTFKSAIQEVLNSKKMRETSQYYGKVLRDRQSSPTDDVVWWTSYLLRTNGAKHLRSEVVHMTWYEIYNLDVWIFLVVCDLLILWFFKKLVVRICCRSQSPSKRRKQKLS